MLFKWFDRDNATEKKELYVLCPWPDFKNATYTHTTIINMKHIQVFVRYLVLGNLDLLAGEL